MVDAILIFIGTAFSFALGITAFVLHVLWEYVLPVLLFFLAIASVVFILYLLALKWESVQKRPSKKERFIQAEIEGIQRLNKSAKKAV